MCIEYNSEIAADYDRSRELPMDSLEAWRHTLAGYIATKPNPRFLDLGSGTGLWSIAFAEWFQAEVIGIDPAAEMLKRARRERSHPKTAQVRGRAEQLPLRDGCCDGAWLSTVIHQIADLQAVQESSDVYFALKARSLSGVPSLITSTRSSYSSISLAHGWSQSNFLVSKPR